MYHLQANMAIVKNQNTYHDHRVPCHCKINEESLIALKKYDALKLNETDKQYASRDCVLQPESY